MMNDLISEPEGQTENNTPEEEKVFNINGVEKKASEISTEDLKYESEKVAELATNLFMNTLLSIDFSFSEELYKVTMENTRNILLVCASTIDRILTDEEMTFKETVVGYLQSLKDKQELQSMKDEEDEATRNTEDELAAVRAEKASEESVS